MKPLPDSGSPDPDPVDENEGSADTAVTTTRWLTRPRLIVGILCASALVLAVGIPITIAQVRSASISSAAADDADRVRSAAASAEATLATFTSSVALAEQHESVFVTPLSVVLNDNGSDFDADTIALFTQSAESMRVLLSDVPSASGLSSDYRSPELSQKLAQRYLAVDDDFREVMRSQAQDEIDRLSKQPRLLEDWMDAYNLAAQDLDAVVSQLTSSAATVREQTLAANAQASADSVAALNAAIAAVPPLDALAIHEQRLLALGDSDTSAELAALLESVPTSLSGYASAAAEVRNSHQAAIAPPPPPAAGGGGGGGSGGWCTWTRFYAGFPVWEWGPCSQRPGG
ncbi:hypothetical protein [Homoserinimonas aerilata]|uniref:hypothetical protein n=1 Tax=Homoserinimonas aerilata TaxID=1162970 RepID=UPI0011512F1D|nr:hypothetical protein [Homoserinimonas aerilata]